MRGKILLVSAVIALVAFSGVLFAMTSEEVSKLPLEQRMKLEEEIRASESIQQEVKLAAPPALFESKGTARNPADITPEVRIREAVIGTRSESEKAVLVAEGFEGAWPPTGWSVIQTCTDVSGPTPGYWTQTDGSAGSPPIGVHSGTYNAGLWWSYNHQDEWLLTLDINLTGSASGTYYVSFWTYGYEGSTNFDHYYVKASTDGGASWDELLDMSALPGNAWNYWAYPYVIDLSAYAGQTIELAWHAVDGPTNDGLWYVWFIDDIEVGYPAEHDVGVTAIYEPVGTYLPDVSVTPSIEVENFGGNDDTFDATFKIFNGTKDEIYSETQSVTVNSGATQTVDFTAFTTVLGSYTTLAYTELVGDEEPSNDTLEGAFDVSDYIPPDTLYYDDGLYDNGWAYYDGGNGWGFKLTPTSYPANINGSIVFLYPDSWPSPGSDYYRVRLLDDDGTGGAPGTVLYDSPVLTGVRGAWNYEDLASENIVIPDGDFYIFYIQEGNYPNCPGIGIDAAVNAPAGCSWEYLSGVYAIDTDVEGDWLLRCVVEYGPPPEHDVGALSIIEPSGTYTAGTVVAPRTRIKNFGANAETFDTYFKIFDGAKDEIYSEVINTTLSPGVMDTLVFPDFTVEEGSYEAISYTDLDIDENPANDTAYSTFGAISYVEDFESGDWPPYGWETYMTGDVADNHGWQSLYDGCPDYPDCLPYEGNFGAWHQDDNVTDNCEDWLVSPLFSFDPGASLSFYHNEYFGGFYVYHGIWVSTGSPDPADGDFVEVDVVPPVDPYVWELYGPVDLSDYSGLSGYIAFKYEGDFADHWYIDYIMGTGISVIVPDHDVGVHEILAPEELVDAGDVYPQVVVKNVGANEETFPVTFQIWGAKQDYTCTETVTLASGLMDTVDFTDPFAATGGSYTTLAYTALAEDENPSNDSIWGEFSVVEWSEDLEEDDGGFEAILDDGFIGWQWGIPTNPEGPANAHSGENVWATNLAGDYDDDADFSLIRKFIALSDNPILYFWHWYDTENKWDGGNVKLSTDDGGSWTVISPMGGYDNVGYSACDYESLFTGRNQGFWELEGFYLSDYVGSGDLFLLNWHFRSDGSAGYYPGWHLDDFAGVGVEAFVPSHDVGVADIVVPVGVVGDGDIVAPEVVVENFGPVTDTFDVTFIIDPSFECNGDRQVYEEVQTVIVDAEATLDVVFPDWTALAGSYDVTAYTILASDTFYNNDTLTEGCIVASWIEDFEDGVWHAPGWADYQLGDANNGWQQFYSGASSSHGDPIGDYGAWHNDDNVSDNCDDWLVTPAYQVGDDAHIYFYQKNYFGSSYEYHGLWVSEGSGVPDDDFEEIEETDVAPSDWTIYGPVNLCDYVGEQIYISFVYQGDYADEWYLDDIIGINLEPKIPYDVSVDDIIVDERVDTLPQGALLHPTAVVSNNSPLGGPTLSFRVIYKIHKDGNIYWRRVYDVMNLPASTSDTVYFSGDVVLNEPGLYTIAVTIQTAFVDPILWNNAMTLDLYIGSGAKMAVDELPKVFALHQNAPNPVRKNTSISYAIPRTSDVTIRVFDISGRVVKTLVNATKEAGYYTANWDMKDNTGREIASGIYFYEFNAGDFKSIKKMVVMR